MFSPEFFKESLTNFRPWLDQRTLFRCSGSFRQIPLTVWAVLADAWEQCQGADVLLESPSAMAGVHIAEALSKF